MAIFTLFFSPSFMLTENFQKSLLFKLKFSPLGKILPVKKKLKFWTHSKDVGGGGKSLAFLYHKVSYHYEM
jgi:hypothetical protein